jgi:hypothetical protein
MHVLLPYVDYNPSRLARDRRFAWAVSFFSVGVIVILSFMGSSAYLVQPAPETEVGFEFMRPEKLGHLDIRTIDFDEMLPGTYDTAALSDELKANSPHLYEKMEALRGLIELYQNPNLKKQLTDGYGVVTIEDWLFDEAGEPLLRKITLNLEWIDETGAPKSFEKYVYTHRDSIYSVE